MLHRIDEKICPLAWANRARARYQPVTGQEAEFALHISALRIEAGPVRNSGRRRLDRNTRSRDANLDQVRPAAFRHSEDRPIARDEMLTPAGVERQKAGRHLPDMCQHREAQPDLFNHVRAVRCIGIDRIRPPIAILIGQGVDVMPFGRGAAIGPARVPQAFQCQDSIALSRHRAEIAHAKRRVSAVDFCRRNGFEVGP